MQDWTDLYDRICSYAAGNNFMRVWTDLCDWICSYAGGNNFMQVWTDLCDRKCSNAAWRQPTPWTRPQIPLGASPSPHHPIIKKGFFSIWRELMLQWKYLQGYAFWSHKESEWVVNVIFYFCLQRASWFDLQGCTFWSHKDTELAVTGIVKLNSLNGIMVWPTRLRLFISQK